MRCVAGEVAAHPSDNPKRPPADDAADTPPQKRLRLATATPQLLLGAAALLTLSHRRHSAATLPGCSSGKNFASSQRRPLSDKLHDLSAPLLTAHGGRASVQEPALVEQQHLYRHSRSRPISRPISAAAIGEAPAGDSADEELTAATQSLQQQAPDNMHGSSPPARDGWASPADSRDSLKEVAETPPPRPQQPPANTVETPAAPQQALQQCLQRREVHGRPSPPPPLPSQQPLQRASTDSRWPPPPPLQKPSPQLLQRAQSMAAFEAALGMPPVLRHTSSTAAPVKLRLSLTPSRYPLPAKRLPLMQPQEVNFNDGKLKSYTQQLIMVLLVIQTVPLNSQTSP